MAPTDMFGQQQQQHQLQHYPQGHGNGHHQQSQEHFDNYLSKLQTICTENMAAASSSTPGGGGVSDVADSKQHQMYDGVKNALQGFNALPAARI
jgi:hypothetical protein